MTFTITAHDRERLPADLFDELREWALKWPLGISSITFRDDGNADVEQKLENERGHRYVIPGTDTIATEIVTVSRDSLAFPQRVLAYLMEQVA